MYNGTMDVATRVRRMPVLDRYNTCALWLISFDWLAQDVVLNTLRPKIVTFQKGFLYFLFYIVRLPQG